MLPSFPSFLPYFLPSFLPSFLKYLAVKYWMLYAVCYEQDSKYIPIDDISGQGRTVASDAVECQTRCEGVSGCSYFSFWADGGCHLSSSAAAKASSSGVTAGPKACSGEGISPKPFLYSCLRAYLPPSLCFCPSSITDSSIMAHISYDLPFVDNRRACCA